VPVICPDVCKLETDKVLLVLFHAKFSGCKIDVAVFSINILLAVKVAAPVSPQEIENMLDDTYEPFKFVSEAP
jgi:hypothetical protein